MNLRDDRPCGRLREYESRVPALGLAAGLGGASGHVFRPGLAVLGCESDIARPRRRSGTSRPTIDRADEAYRHAISEDGYNARPWLEPGFTLHWMHWQRRSEGREHDTRWSWKRSRSSTSSPRPRRATPAPGRCSTRRRRVIQQICWRDRLEARALEAVRTRGKIVEATRRPAAESHQRRAARAARRRECRDQHVSRTPSTRRPKPCASTGFTPHRDKKLPEQCASGLETLIPDVDRERRQDADRAGSLKPADRSKSSWPSCPPPAAGSDRCAGTIRKPDRSAA